MRPIDGDKLMKEFCGACFRATSKIDCLKCNSRDCRTIGIIRAQDTLDTRAAKCGTWIEKEHYRVHGEDYKDYVCSECDHRISRPAGFCPDYCEDCGAKNAIS